MKKIVIYRELLQYFAGLALAALSFVHHVKASFLQPQCLESLWMPDLLV